MMSTKNLGIIYRICLLFLIVPDSMGWGYEIGEHAAINDWILDKSVGGFEFDQYVKQYLGFDGGMNDKCISSISILNWLTFNDSVRGDQWSKELKISSDYRSHLMVMID